MRWASRPVAHNRGVNDQRVPAPLTRGLDPETRRFVAIVVAGSTIGWWPAFTLGVYGVIFFEQHLALWAAATSAFLALMVAGGPVARHRYSTYALLVPSVWLVLLWLLPVTNSGPAHILLFWIGVAITLLGVPALAAFMIRLLIPSTEHLSRRQGASALAVVLCVMATAFFLGTQHPHMLSCEDFSISGNFAPADCNPGVDGEAP